MAPIHQNIQVSTVKLGSQGLEVSKIGFGCYGLTEPVDKPNAEEAGIAIIKEAFQRGVTFFDTSDIYGNFTNEIIVGKALKHLPREKVQIATKFGLASLYPQAIIKGNAEYVRSSCEASLKRLDVDYIDLYYQHAVDTTVPIEETMGELKKLVEEGKIKYVGLSEASPDTIRRAHALHPISCLEMEWSLWTREIEEEIVPLCRELGIGLVAHSPLGRGLSAGRGIVEPLPDIGVVAFSPRYRPENLDKNKEMFYRLEKIASKHGCKPAQLALSWIMHQGDDVVPIPGTTSVKNLEINMGSLKIKLTEEDVKEVGEAVPQKEVAGARMLEIFMPTTWKFANTPPCNGVLA